MNRELIARYCDIGRLILGRQRREGWGAKVIDRLSQDLQWEFASEPGFSPRNLKYLRTFAEAWPETGTVRPSAAQLAKGKSTREEIVQAPHAQISAVRSLIVQALLAQLPWYPPPRPPRQARQTR